MPRTPSAASTKTAPTVSAEDRKKARQRAAEWKTFRRNFLFSQKALSDHLGCGRRTVVAIESGTEVFNPRADPLRRFRDLKRAQEIAEKRYETEVA